MYCPKCGSQGDDDVLYCRGCGADLMSVRSSLETLDRGLEAHINAHLSKRQLRRMRRRGIDGTETPLALATRAIELQSSAVRGLILGVIFAFITYYIYLTPPIGGIFWLLPLIPMTGFFAASLSRFAHAAMIRKLLREAKQTGQPAELPNAQPEYLQPPRSIYETDELAQPRSVTDATTRHLR